MITAVLFTGLSMISCYNKTVEYSIETSYGGTVSGPFYYYMAEIKEYRSPKGISRFPDGGMSKILRKQFGIYRTDTINLKTSTVALFPQVSGWPSGYTTRMDSNDSCIVVGIYNLTAPDATDGIYLISTENGAIRKYNNLRAFPAFSPVQSEMAYCIGNNLIIDNYEKDSTILSFKLKSEPVFIEWNSENLILLFCSEPFRTEEIDIKHGMIRDSKLKYVSNYAQELDAGQIRKMIKISKPDFKEMLDNNP